MHNNFRNRYVIVNARFLTQSTTGVQRFAIEICRHLKNLIPDIHFVSPRNIMHKDLALELNVEAFGKYSSHVWEQIELPFFLKKSGSPLLINLCNTAPVYYSNKIVCIHDLAFIINPHWFSRTFSAVYKYIIPRIAKSSRRIITVSNYSKSSIQTFLQIPEKEIDVIYNAVSESFIRDDSVTQSNKYGRYILAVSSIEPRKNLKNLIIGFKLAELTGIKLVIVGAGSKVFNDPDLKSLVQNRDNIIFTGYLSDFDLVGVYKNALVFVYPSLFEGFGIPPLEAMYCGCPTIVSDSSSLPEVCADASIYINPLKADEIANALKLVLADEELRNRLILKGFNRAKNFNWNNSAEKLAGIINKLK